MLFRKKRQLDLEQKKYAVLSEFSDTILFEYDSKTDILEFTSNAKRKLFLSSLKLKEISKENHILDLLYQNDLPILQNIFLSMSEKENDTTEYAEVRLKTIDSKYLWFGCQFKYIAASSSEIPSKIIGKLVDIDNQIDREKTLIEQARRDILTDVYNKSGESLIDEILSKEGSGLFFMIDLDNFKEINDSCGHATGDEILTKVGAVLKGLFRPSDIVARVGGDEFVAFISGNEDRNLAALKAQSVLNGIKGIVLKDSGDFISASIGIAVSPDNGSTYKALYEAADKAMYAVKQNKKDGYAFYNG